MPNDPVVGIIRVSSPGQAADDKGGIPRQRAAIEAAIRLHDLRNVARVDTIQETGTHILEDPKFQRIMRELKDGTIKGVVVAEQSRLIRPEDLGDMLIFDIFKRAKALIYTPTNRIDPTTPEGIMLLGMTGIMSALEIGLIKARMVGARNELRAEGFSAGGRNTLPKGVSYTKYPKGQRGGVWGHTEFAQKIRQCYALLFRGENYEAMSRLSGLTINGVKATLSNPIWYGVRRFEMKCTGPERRIRPGFKFAGSRYRLKRRVDPALVQWVPIDIPHLITEAEWKRAQAIIEQRRGERRAQIKPHRLIVPTGLLRCEQCNLPFYCQCYNRNKEWDRYHCASHCANRRRAGQKRAALKKCDTPVVKRTILERTLELAIQRFFTVPLLRELLDRAQGRDTAPELRDAETKLARLRQKLERLTDLFVNEMAISKPDYLRRKAPLEREIKLIEAARPVELPQCDARATAQALAAPFTEYPLLQPDEKRSLLTEAVKEILIDGDGITGMRFQGGFLAQNTVSKTRNQTYSGSDFQHSEILHLQFAETVRWAAAA